MSDSCTPANVVGKLTAALESTGIIVEQGAVEALSTSGQAAYHRFANKAANEIDDLTPTEHSEAVKSAWGFLDKTLLGQGGEVLGRVLTDQRNPSTILGENVVGPVSKFVTEHYKTVYQNLPDGSESALSQAAKTFRAGVKEVFESIPTTGMNALQEGYFKQYRRFYEKEGGELYSTTGQTGLGQAVGNVVQNTIKSSPTVILGNPLEVAIKLPALYPKETLPGLAQWVARGGLFRKFPELEEVGLYGFARPDEKAGVIGKLNARWEGLIQLTDVPTKNLVYLAGAHKGGEQAGLKAVQDVLFQMRLGDLPRQRWSGAGRQQTGLISYSINTMKLHGGLWASAFKPSSSLKQRTQALSSLVIMYGVTTGLGGQAALVPEPLEKMMVSVYPETKDWFEENRNEVTRLIQLQGVGRLGVGFDVAGRQSQKAYKSLLSAADALDEGDYKRFMADGGLAVAKLYMFTQSPLGDAQIQKGLNLARDIFLDDLDNDLNEEIKQSFFPFIE